MSLWVESILSGVLDKLRTRTNTSAQRRIIPVDKDTGVYLVFNEVTSFSPPSMRKLNGMRHLTINRQTHGGTDPIRGILGHAQKLSGVIEHTTLKTARRFTLKGVHAARTIEIDLLTGYGALAELEVSPDEEFLLRQGQNNLPQISMVSGLMQAIGRSMARVDLTSRLDENTIAADKNGEVINRRHTDTLLAGVSGLLLEPLWGSNEGT